MKTKTKRYYTVNFKNEPIYFTSMKHAKIMSLILKCPVKQCYTKNSDTYQKIEKYSYISELILLDALEYARAMVINRRS